MKKRGLTLIELIAVMAMTAIVGLAIMSLFISQYRLFNRVNNETIIQDEARLILTAIEDDFKLGRNTIISTTASKNVTIGSNNYLVPLLDGVSGIVVYGYSKNEKNSTGSIVVKDFAYILYGKTLVRTNGVTPGTNLVKDVNLSKNVKLINISKETGTAVPPSIKYKIKIELEKGTEKQEFNSVMVKR